MSEKGPKSIWIDGLMVAHAEVRRCGHYYFDAGDESNVIEYVRSDLLDAAKAAVWKQAIEIARDYSQAAGNSAFSIRDRYGEGTDDEESEYIAQAMADKIVSALEAAAVGETEG